MIFSDDNKRCVTHNVHTTNRKKHTMRNITILSSLFLFLALMSYPYASPVADSGTHVCQVCDDAPPQCPLRTPCSQCGNGGNQCPSPTPPPGPSVCEFGKISTHVTNPTGKHDQRKYSKEQYYAGSTNLNNIPCLKAIQDSIWNQSINRRHNKAKAYDDDIATGFLNSLLKGKDSSLANAGCQVWVSLPHDLKDFADDHNRTCGSGAWFVDKNCNLVSASSVDPSKVCDNLNVTWSRSTPISLIWGDHKSGDTTGVAIYGSLELSGEKSWILWKGSEATPLLVFDPERTGKVSSPAQLFGDWTFGGKQTAALSGSAVSPQPQPWKHGYEALATLDSNGNGKIDAEELSSLSLWFDKNQNAVSEEGELVPATELGITAIYFNVDPSVEGGLAKDINLQVGYERVKEDGTVIVGASVDWYTPKLASPAEVMQYLGAASMYDEPRYDSEFLKEFDTQGEGVSSHGKASSEGSVVGNWHWRIEDGTQESGIFVFIADENDGDLVAGYSLTQRNLPEGEAANALLSSLFLKGKRAVNSDGVTELTLNSVNIGGLQLSSTAVLSKDGKSMKGHTVVKGNDFGNITTAEYNWTAEKQ